MKRALIVAALIGAMTQAYGQAQLPIVKQETRPGHFTYHQGGHYLGHSERNPSTRTEMYYPSPSLYRHQHGCCTGLEGYQIFGNFLRGLGQSGQR